MLTEQALGPAARDGRPRPAASPGRALAPEGVEGDPVPAVCDPSVLRPFESYVFRSGEDLFHDLGTSIGPLGHCVKRHIERFSDLTSELRIDPSKSGNPYLGEIREEGPDAVRRASGSPRSAGRSTREQPGRERSGDGDHEPPCSETTSLP